MVIQIRIPQSIINTCKECGWDELETKEYFSRYMDEVMNDPYKQFEQDFQVWLQDQDEEELAQLVTEDQPLKVGMQVEVLDGTATDNVEGDVGIITEVDGSDIPYRVTVEGRTNAGNWMRRNQVVRINY